MEYTIVHLDGKPTVGRVTKIEGAMPASPGPVRAAST